MQTIENLMSKVYPEPNTGCWLWGASCNTKGYGTAQNFDGKVEATHRLFFKIFKGPIPNGFFVCHKCDTPQCVNPDHLWIGSRSDNHYDCVNKKRHHQTKKTHCPSGHEYTMENTRVKISKNGCKRRHCLECTRASDRDRQRLKRQKTKLASHN